MAEEKRTIHQLLAPASEIIISAGFPNHIPSHRTRQINKALVETHLGTDFEEIHCINYSTDPQDAIRGKWELAHRSEFVRRWLAGEDIGTYQKLILIGINANALYKRFGGAISEGRSQEIEDFIVLHWNKSFNPMGTPNNTHLIDALAETFDDTPFRVNQGRLTYQIVRGETMETPTMLSKSTTDMIPEEVTLDAKDSVRIRDVIVSDSTGNIFTLEIPVGFKATVKFVGATTEVFTNKAKGTWSMTVPDWDTNTAKITNFSYLEIVFESEE